MALIVADRVQELTTTSGTGTLTLNGAVSGFQTFSNGIGNTNTTYYTIYDSTAYVWEVGIGTVGAGTLSRDTVLANSLGSTAKINLAGNQASVFCTYPADKSVNLDANGNVSPLGTISSGIWQGTTVGVAYGGTGVTTSSGANSVVLRDANQNITVNRLNQSNTTVTAAAGTTALTAASSYSQTLVGTGNQTYTMPDATTLTTGVDFVFNNNATGVLTLRDAASGLLGTVTAGGACAIMLLDNGTVAGTWNLHGFLPESVTWGTNALDLGTTIVSNGTWQGGTIGTAYGGTGLTTFVASNNALFSTSASALTAGTLPVAAGGTGVTTSTGTTSVVLSDGPTLTGAVTIGSTTGTDTITVGQSTGSYTLNLGIGAGGTGVTKTVNVGTGSSGLTANSITIGPTAGTGTTTVNIAAQARAGGTSTINIGTAASGGTVGITIGSPIAGSSTTLNGTVTLANALAVTSGGTGQTTYTDGQLLIGNSTGNTLTKATLTAGSGISITNGAGSITIASSGGSGDVVGPASATDNAIARFDGTTGKLIQNSAVTIDDTTGSINFTGTSARFLADFSNNTISNRLIFQSNVTNGNTAVGFATNGTGNSTRIVLYNSSDVANNSVLRLESGSTTTIIDSGKNGSGSVLPLSIQVGNFESILVRTDKGVEFKGAIEEQVYAVVDAAGVALSPSNGTIQTWTLGASRTPTSGTWNEGESMTLMIDDGTARTITWTTLNVVWESDGGNAPTLATTGFTVIVLWKVSTQIYGARVGNA